MLVTCAALMMACGRRQEAEPAESQRSSGEASVAAPWRGLPEVWTPEEAFAPATRNPFPDGHVPKEAFKRSPTPPLSAGEVLLTGPADKLVRKHYYERDRALVSEVSVKSVALDFDAADELLVTIPRGEGKEASQWLVLLDPREGGHVVAGEWAWPGVRASARVFAHPVGGRALLWVTLEGAEVSMVEAHSLSAEGTLKLVARLGGAVAERGRLTVEASKRLPVVHREREGRRESWALSVSSTEFAMVPVPSDGATEATR